MQDYSRLTLADLLNVEAELQHAPSPPENEYGLPWWQTDYGRCRSWAEVTAMRRFPGFKASLSEELLVVWRGRLESGLNPGRTYLVEVTYPWEFPDEAPSVAIVRPHLPDGVPHLLSGQHPCLYRGGAEDGYDPGCTTAATLVAWTALWIHAFETWLATGVWPGAED